MEILYALRIKAVDSALLTWLNNGVALDGDLKKGEPWLLIKLEEDGSGVTTQVLPKRELFEHYDIKGQVGHSPMIVRLKRDMGEK